MLTRYQTEFDLYIRLELSGTLKCPAGWKGAEHRHAFWEILFSAEGEFDVCAGEQTQHLEAGRALLIAPMTEHFSTACEEGATMSYVGFRCETGRELLGPGAAGLWLLPEDAAGFSKLTGIMREMTGSRDFQQYGGRLIQALMPVTAWLNERHVSRDGHAGSQKNILCRKTVKYIRSNLHRFVTVEEIASSLYVTPHYLGLVFSSSMGQTILKFQQAAKMERASALVRGGMAITDVSNSLGYSSPQYFSKCFKSYFGFPPNRMKANKKD